MKAGGRKSPMMHLSPSYWIKTPRWARSGSQEALGGAQGVTQTGAVNGQGCVRGHGPGGWHRDRQVAQPGRGWLWELERGCAGSHRGCQVQGRTRRRGLRAALRERQLQGAGTAAGQEGRAPPEPGQHPCSGDRQRAATGSVQASSRGPGLLAPTQAVSKHPAHGASP